MKVQFHTAPLRGSFKQPVSLEERLKIALRLQGEFAAKALLYAERAASVLRTLDESNVPLAREHQARAKRYHEAVEKARKQILTLDTAIVERDLQQGLHKPVAQKGRKRSKYPTSN